jgi:CubicO group peptidase (beta-lactamase class C family)
MLTLRRWMVAMAICAMSAFHAAASAAEADAVPGFHEEFEAALEAEALVGVVWATVTPDAIETGAAGLADARHGTVLSADSRMQTGSIAKTVIAAGILRLVTEGRLSLESPVATLLPGIAFENPWAASDPVRVRHLLDHTAGLDDARLWQVFSLEADPDSPLRAGLQRSPLQVRSRPGSRLSYANQGYTLLGMVIERITGERYEHHLDTHLLQPLGMRDSTFRFVSQHGPQADDRLAMGHFEQGAAYATIPLTLRPAGQFTTTASDMARFARFLMGNGEIDGQPFIATELLRAMGRPTTTEATAAGLVHMGYGLGLNSRDRHGVLGHCHVGTTIGFRANFCLFPEAQKAFFVAMNADVETADYDRFDAALIRSLDVATALPAKEAAPPGDVADWQGIYVLSPNRNESFAYLDRVMNVATLRWDGRRLLLTPFQGTTRSLLPVGGRLFRAGDRASASHVLLVSDSRRVISDGFRSYEQVSLWRMLPLWGSLVAGVTGLAWLILCGLIRLLRRRLRASDPSFVPFLASLALLLPVPLFFLQSFLQLGDLTPASAVLALVTGLLPLSMGFGLWRSFRPDATRRSTLDRLAMLGVLQWSLVLACWGLLPLCLWR